MRSALPVDRSGRSSHALGSRDRRMLVAEGPIKTRSAERRPRRLRQFVTTVALIGALLLGAATETALAQQQQLTPQIRQQLQAIIQDKASRTPAQRKISSQLLYELKRGRADPLFSAVPGLRTNVEVAPDGTTLVDIKAQVTDDLLNRIGALGGSVINSFPRYNAIRARIPLDQVETLAESSDVKSIRPADQAITNVTSEGDAAHRAPAARGQGAGFDGSGIKICALSDGVDQLASLQTAGELPDTCDLGDPFSPCMEVLTGQAGSGSEGTALLEIIHDLAPGADLAFATAFNGQASFATNIRDLRSTLGCDVIVDDVFYFAESVFQDDDIAQSVNFVTEDGAMYFSSAGNSGNLNDGTAGVWEGDFADSGVNMTVGAKMGDLHEFNGSGDITNGITDTAPSVVTLHWSDPKGASGNDYDFCASNSAVSVVFACGTDIQDGNDDPFEIIGPQRSNRHLIIWANTGAQPRYLHLNTNRGELEHATDGQTSGHKSAKNAFSVAAVDAADANGGAFKDNLPLSVETFSSDGPRRIFFDANGNPVTPGDFSSTGGEVRQDPDITAADGVAVATSGFNPFFGTSAAAPHAAAIAGLLLSTGASPVQVRGALTGTAIDIEGAGVDRDSGVGIIDASDAMARILSNNPNLTGRWSKLQQGCTPGNVSCAGIGKFVVENNGTGSAAASTVRFYLSSDETFDGGDNLLTAVLIDAVTGGATKSAKLNVDLPIASGSRSSDFVLGIVDFAGVVMESDETDNTIVFGPLE